MDAIMSEGLRSKARQIAKAVERVLERFAASRDVAKLRAELAGYDSFAIVEREIIGSTSSSTSVLDIERF